VISIRRDRDLRRSVLEELAWEPRVELADIRVDVHDGIVALSGRAPTPSAAEAAREAALRVLGVRSVVDEVAIRPPGEPPTDAELARAVRDALVWDLAAGRATLRCEVRDGWVRLEGEVGRWREREAAVRAAVRIAGVRGVSSAIRVRPRRGVL
jgi:osmotically-inducible protein OsmY